MPNNQLSAQTGWQERTDPPHIPGISQGRLRNCLQQGNSHENEWNKTPILFSYNQRKALLLFETSNPIPEGLPLP